MKDDWVIGKGESYGLLRNSPSNKIKECKYNHKRANTTVFES